MKLPEELMNHMIILHLTEKNGTILMPDMDQPNDKVITPREGTVNFVFPDLRDEETKAYTFERSECHLVDPAAQVMKFPIDNERHLIMYWREHGDAVEKGIKVADIIRSGAIRFASIYPAIFYLVMKGKLKK